MKKLTFLAAAILLAATSCKKSTTTPTTTPKTTTPATTSPMEGNWTIKTYDGMDLATPAAGTYKATATSATEGSVAFDITFDGTKHSIEDATYVMSAGNTQVVFTKTGGDYNVLNGGKTWTIDSMTGSLLRIKSQYGLIIRMTK